MPGQVLFVDLIPNPARSSAAPRTHYRDYMIVVCAYSRYFVFVPMLGHSADDTINGINFFVTNHKPFANYAPEDISEIHADAGTNFDSSDFKDWASEHNIKIILAAPQHQEMNGLPERLWQTARQIAFKLLTEARLALSFFHFAMDEAVDETVVE